MHIVKKLDQKFGLQYHQKTTQELPPMKNLNMNFPTYTINYSSKNCKYSNPSHTYQRPHAHPNPKLQTTPTSLSIRTNLPLLTWNAMNLQTNILSLKSILKTTNPSITSFFQETKIQLT